MRLGGAGGDCNPDIVEEGRWRLYQDESLLVVEVECVRNTRWDLNRYEDECFDTITVDCLGEKPGHSWSGREELRV